MIILIFTGIYRWPCQHIIENYEVFLIFEKYLDCTLEFFQQVFLVVLSFFTKLNVLYYYFAGNYADIIFQSVLTHGYVLLRFMFKRPAYADKETAQAKGKIKR